MLFWGGGGLQAGRQCEMSRVPLLFSLAGDPLAFLRASIRGHDLQSACLLLLLVQDRALQLVEDRQEGSAEVGGKPRPGPGRLGCSRPAVSPATSLCSTLFMGTP
jgi:hypothetical protein